VHRTNNLYKLITINKVKQYNYTVHRLIFSAINHAELQKAMYNLTEVTGTQFLQLLFVLHHKMADTIEVC